MAIETIKHGKPGKVAKQIETDFLKKGLRPGDRYFSAIEASTVLGVSQSTADRAMRILANQKKLVRKPRGGTFIGPSVKPTKKHTKTKAIYVFYFAGMEEALSFGLVSKAIYNNFERVGIRFISIPAEEAFSYFCETIDSAIEKGNILGAVLVSGTRDMYKYLHNSGVKAIVFGTLYSDQKFFTSIDRDSKKSAKLLVEYLIRKGRQKLLVLVKNIGRAGSDEFIDAIYDTANKVGLSPGDVKIRVCNGNLEETAARVSGLFSSDDRPDGIIVDGNYLLDLAEKVCLNKNLQIGKDIDIVFEGGAVFNIQPRKFVHTCVAKDKENYIDDSIRKLRKIIKGGNDPCKHIVLPVKLVEPEE